MTSRIFGNVGFTIVSVIMFLAVLAYVNASLLSNPRVYYAMAEEHVLPRIAVFILRKRGKQQGEAIGIYKMRFYPWMTIIFIVGYALVNAA